MGSRKRWIPFGLWPANWGLEGRRRAEAETEYYWDGEDKERHLIDLIGDPQEQQLKHLDLDLKYEKINQREYDLKRIDIEHSDHETLAYRIDLIHHKVKHGELSEREGRKEIAILRDEPWFEIVNSELLSRPDLGSAFNFELDWNEAFIKDLVEQGWVGVSDEQIVDRWFSQTCAQIFADFEEEDQVMPTPVTGSNRTQRNDLGDDKAEYS